MAEQDEQKALNSDIRFNNQAYLNSYIDDIIDSKIIENQYQYISKLITDTNDPFAKTLALLSGKSKALLLSKLKTYQYNSLIPKVRLYRVDSDGTELEFIFSKDTKFTNTTILGESFTVGNNCGIKSFNWTLAGSNPVSAQKNIEVKLELYFDSIAAFSGGSYNDLLEFWNGKGGKPPTNFRNSPVDDYSSNTTKNYWSLIYHPRTDPSSYATSLFRIKAIVGWEEIDPNIIKEIFKNNNINEEIENTNLVMYLNLVAHSFQFNEDGSIKLIINYIGSFENATSSKEFDLFRGLKEKLNSLSSLALIQLNELAGRPSREGVEYNDTTAYSLENNTKRLQLISYVKNNKGNTNLKDEIKKCNELNPNTIRIDPEQIEELQKYSNETLDTISKKIDESVTRLQEGIDAARVAIKNEFYSALIKELLVKDEQGKYSMYKIKLADTDVKNWVRWKNKSLPDKPDFPYKNSNGRFGSTDGSNDADKIQGSVDGFSQARTGKNIDEGTKAYNEYEEKIRKEEETVESKTIYFTTVGMLIDCAYRVIKKKDYSTPEDFYKKNVLFANFAQNKNIADIPVDLNYYIKFLNDNIYETQKEEYSLFQYMRDVISKIAESALESREEQSEEFNKYANTSLATTELVLGNTDKLKHPLSNFYIDGTRNIDLRGKTISDVKQYFINKQNKLIPFIYHIIYDKYQKDFSSKGNIVSDEEKGIYHYTLAQDYGLVKAINFKKIDQPFLKESKSVGKQTVYLGQFRDLYNADIKLIGNNIYIPGMMLLIKPSIEFGNPIGSTANPSFSQITGVGGYYSVIKVTNEINQESYTTSLDCVFQSNEYGNPEDAPENCNYRELEKAGLLDSKNLPNIDSEDINQILKEARGNQDLAEEEAERDRKEAEAESLDNAPSTFP